MKLEFVNNEGHIRTLKTRTENVDIIYAMTGEVLIQDFPLECYFLMEDENDFQFRCIGIDNDSLDELDKELHKLEDWESTEIFIDNYEIPDNYSHNILYVKTEWDL